jgi:ubiquinone/menaquinone biosynthesis C-methylase UbiE
MRKVLPASVKQTMRRFIPAGGPQLFVTYEVVKEWPKGNDSSWTTPAVAARFKHGIETFDLDLAQQSPSAAFASPIVRDNLVLLSRINLSAATLLDFGCGNGLYHVVLQHYPATKGWTYVGTDINEDILDWCRMRHPGIRFVPMKGNECLPFDNDAFHVVMASGVIQCINDYPQVLADLHRVSNSYILVSRLPMWSERPTQIVLQHVRSDWGFEDHAVRVFNREEFDALIARLGLTIVAREDGSEVFQIQGVPEPAIHSSYLLQKVVLN